MFALNKTDITALTYIGILFFMISTLVMVEGYTSSKYQPRPIIITPVSEKSLFELENSMDCVPGAKDGSPYTKGLTPGGICGAQELVDDLASYEIDGGIGGSLI
jgi:hypothetical protein